MDTIYIDIDGTAADSIPWWLSLYNVEHHTSWQKSDIVRYNIESFGIELAPFYRDYRGVKFEKDAHNVILQLQTRYNVVFVTVGYGVSWLQDAGLYDKKHYIWIADRSLLKGEYLIDDNIENVMAFPGNGLLLQQPWNTEYGGYTWEEIGRMLLYEKKREPAP